MTPMESAIPRPSPPAKKQRYHHGDLRNAIIDAVAQLIGEKRALTFHLSEVAALVGTTQAAIYKHFDSKEALLVETAVAGYKLQRRFREVAIAESDDSPLAGILAIGEAYVFFSINSPGFFLLIKTLETKEILSSDIYVEERNRSIDRITLLIEDCVRSGLFSETDIEISRTVLQATAYGIAHLYITNQVDLIARNSSRHDWFPTNIFVHGMTSLLSENGLRELKDLVHRRAPPRYFARAAESWS